MDLSDLTGGILFPPALPLYYRFNLSAKYARRLKLRYPGYGDTFYIAEVFVKINGQQQYLWRAFIRTAE
jgi:transposase-like protein